MPDSKNPFTPYTQQWQDHDRKYDAAQEARRRREERAWADLLQSQTDSRTTDRGSAAPGGDASSDRAAGVGLLAAIGLFVLFSVVYAETDNAWLGGAAVVAAVAALAAIAWFFKTAAGQFLLTLIGIAVTLAGLGFTLYLIYLIGGTTALAWTGVVVAGLFALWLTLKLLGMFLATTIGQVVLWGSVIAGGVYLWIAFAAAA